ncbi:MAG TPA: crosslink repair DNA glycosylase YcaQ family protein [Ilumatobacteraceae bacterium]|nr:crosslink repair DNA glycosylase YcaQ family protein [Ilumatobacteraceae bacterium]
MTVRRLSRDDARRIAVRAQLLDADRPGDLMTVVDRLTFLQLDPTAVIAPNADLVTWTRVGNTYDPADLRRAIDEDRTLFEHRGQESEKEPVIVMVRPMANLGLYLAEMAMWPIWTKGREWLDANARFRKRVLAQLKSSGPLQSRDIADSAEVPWQSSGWTHDRNVTQMLELLASRGEIAVAGRRGKQRVWDLAERIFPAGVTVVPVEEARAIRNEKRLRSLGVARSKIVGNAGIAAEVEGTTGEWRVDPDATAQGFEGRTALLSPFDRLVHDRVRALELFGFDYTLEMYKPAAARRWGYFALPILHDDQLVGKVDAAADRKTSQLLVHAVHQDVRFTRATTAAVNAELESLAAWLGLDTVSRS